MKQPKIGLALGSGGSKGFSHIGVLKVLEEAGVRIDCMAGSSMGGLAVALYGAGHSVHSLYKMATTFKRKYYLDFIVPKMGFIAGDKLKKLLHVITYEKNIEDLEPEVAIIATDLLAGERVVFRKGSAAQAVRASVSIPGVLVPEQVDGKMLVDGGVIDHVPVDTVREMGADIVIAVDVDTSSYHADVHSIFDVIMQSINVMQKEMVRSHDMSADFLIKPDLSSFQPMKFERESTAEMIRRGEAEARKVLPQILNKIESWPTHP